MRHVPYECARRSTRAAQKQMSWNVFFGLFRLCLPADVPEIVSAVSEPFLDDLSAWRIREEGKGKGTIGGIEVALICMCPKCPQKWKTLCCSRWTGRVALVSHESSDCSHSADPPTPVLNQKLRTSAKKTSPLQLLLSPVCKPVPPRAL